MTKKDGRSGWAARALALVALLVAAAPGRAESGSPPAPTYDEALARQLGADEYGMRSYVLVILKSGPTPVPKGPERDAMFHAHLDNIRRLAAEGKLVLAGPLDGVDGWRGLFVFAVAGVDEAKQLVATDPAVQRGELAAEYHQYYGSAALVEVNALHQKIARQNP